MTNSNPEGQTFYLTLTQLMDSFSCSPFDSSFSYLKSFPKVPEYAEIRHDMTSLKHNNDVTDDFVAGVPIQPMYSPHMTAWVR